MCWRCSHLPLTSLYRILIVFSSTWSSMSLPIIQRFEQFSSRQGDLDQLGECLSLSVFLCFYQTHGSVLVPFLGSHVSHMYAGLISVRQTNTCQNRQNPISPVLIVFRQHKKKVGYGGQNKTKTVLEKHIRISVLWYIQMYISIEHIYTYIYVHCCISYYALSNITHTTLHSSIHAKQIPSLREYQGFP